MSQRPIATIHLDNIAANWRALARGTGRTGAVIKADAYGHGLQPVARCLAQAGCRDFFVAHLEEALEARALPALDSSQIFVLNGPEPGTLARYREHRLTPVLNTPSQVENWAREGAAPAPALKFDTGMNRLGLKPGAIPAVKELLGPQGPVLVMSHLVSSEIADAPLNARQAARFHEICQAFPGVATSLANSGGCHLGPAFGQQLSRPGIFLYGGDTPAHAPTPRPGMTLTAAVLAVFEADARETVGYGASYTLRRASRLATLAIGYGDGLPRQLSNRGQAHLGGALCPIVGRVSMDLTTVDITDTDTAVREGDVAEVIGAKCPLMDQAAAADTIGYDLVTGLLPRVRRVYEGATRA